MLIYIMLTYMIYMIYIMLIYIMLTYRHIYIYTPTSLNVDPRGGVNREQCSLPSPPYTRKPRVAEVFQMQFRQLRRQ